MDTDPTKTNSTKKPPKENRQIWWALVALSLITIAVSGIALAQRIANYNKTTAHPLYAYTQINATAFTFAGRTLELVEDTIGDRDVIRVRFGDEELILDVAIPPLYPLPTLYERQSDWLTISFFADRSGMTMDEFQSRIESDEIRPRLGLVTRTPFGVDPLKAPFHKGLAQEKNWGNGEVRRDLWRFDCYEFLRDGSIVHEEKRFPESGSSLLRRQNYAKLKGEPIPGRGEGELEEYTWERGAALKIMPRAPSITMEQQALLASGWTMPTATASFLLLIVSFFFAIAPSRTTKATA